MWPFSLVSDAPYFVQGAEDLTHFFILYGILHYGTLHYGTLHYGITCHFHVC
jgi:hypothetical protein